MLIKSVEMLYPFGSLCDGVRREPHLFALCDKRQLVKVVHEAWALHEKIRYCSIVRLRRRIWVYLCDRQPAPGVPFTIPFDRSGLAAYLNADRSALSRELSRMKNDGLLEYHKNRFRLLKPR